MATKNEVFGKYKKEYVKASKKRKGAILDAVCEVTGMCRKSVIRKFRRLQMKGGTRQEGRGRPERYTPDVIAALKYVWDAAGEPCGENIHPLIAEYAAILRRDTMWKHSDEATDKLLGMSLGTMKKRILKFKRMSFPSHGRSTTAPGAIHAVIPIRSGPWDTAPVGTMQVDTVAHCGDSTAGDFIFTVNSTDVATLWGVRRCQWNKGQAATIRSMEAMDEDAPFPIIEWHPDSGSEFINWHCFDWSVAREQKITRSRPNRKNDNCFVEERNGHVVRRWLGYARFDLPELVDALNAVYDVLTPYLNHFAASRRTISKERIGAKWKITREKISMTPYQRVLLREDISVEVKDLLTKEHEKLNPLILKREIDRRLKLMFDIRKRHDIPMARTNLR